MVACWWASWEAAGRAKVGEAVEKGRVWRRERRVGGGCAIGVGLVSYWCFGSEANRRGGGVLPASDAARDVVLMAF